MIRLVLLREVQSGNALAYGHWRNRMKDRDAWLALIRHAHAARYSQAIGKRRVTVTAYRKRTLDSDNLSAGFKHGRDCLTKCGLLVDDSPRWSEFTYRQHVLSEIPDDLAEQHGRKPLTVIEIEEMHE